MSAEVRRIVYTNFHYLVTSVKFHPTIPAHVLSSGFDGNILLYNTLLPDTEAIVWKAPEEHVPIVANSIDMLSSIAIAGLDNASILLWRMNL